MDRYTETYPRTKFQSVIRGMTEEECENDVNGKRKSFCIYLNDWAQTTKSDAEWLNNSLYTLAKEEQIAAASAIQYAGSYKGKINAIRKPTVVRSSGLRIERIHLSMKTFLVDTLKSSQPTYANDIFTRTFLNWNIWDWTNAIALVRNANVLYKKAALDSATKRKHSSDGEVESNKAHMLTPPNDEMLQLVPNEDRDMKEPTLHDGLVLLEQAMIRDISFKQKFAADFTKVTQGLRADIIVIKARLASIEKKSQKD